MGDSHVDGVHGQRTKTTTISSIKYLIALILTAFIISLFIFVFPSGDTNQKNSHNEAVQETENQDSKAHNQQPRYQPPTNQNNEAVQKVQNQGSNQQPRYQPPTNQNNEYTYPRMLKDYEDGIQNYKAGLFGLAAKKFIQCLSYENTNYTAIFYDKQAICANYLAVMYSEGKGGLSVNQHEAFKLLNFSANHGYRSAQFNLAKRYQNGIGTKQDTKKAVYWYTQAAKFGVVDAAKALGSIYEKGLGDVSADSGEALRWYKYALKMNSNDASIKAAIKRLQGGSAIQKSQSSSKHEIKELQGDSAIKKSQSGSTDDEIESIFKLADRYFDVAQYADAALAYQTVIKSSNTAHSVLIRAATLRQGICFLKLKQIPAAKARFTRVINFYPGTKEAHTALLFLNSL